MVILTHSAVALGATEQHLLDMQDPLLKLAKTNLLGARRSIKLLKVAQRTVASCQGRQKWVGAPLVTCNWQNLWGRTLLQTLLEFSGFVTDWLI
jgi:hypothetical protein